MVGEILMGLETIHLIKSTRPLQTISPVVWYEKQVVCTINFIVIPLAAVRPVLKFSNQSDWEQNPAEKKQKFKYCIGKLLNSSLNFVNFAIEKGGK